MRSIASLGRALAPTLLVAALAACPGDPSSPSPLAMAGRFEELARAHATDPSAPTYSWHLAAVALRSGAPVGSITVEIDGQARTFQAVAMQVGTVSAGSDHPALTFLVGWGDREGREVLHLWAVRDSIELAPFGPQPPGEFTPPQGGASFHTPVSDSIWLHESGWAKLAPTVAAGSCRSSLRPSDVCRVVTVNVGASTVMRAVRTPTDTTPPWPTHQLAVRAARIGGVAIFQPCDPDACSVEFP